MPGKTGHAPPAKMMARAPNKPKRPAALDVAGPLSVDDLLLVLSWVALCRETATVTLVDRVALNLLADSADRVAAAPLSDGLYLLTPNDPLDVKRLAWLKDVPGLPDEQQ